MSIEIERERLERMLMLLAVATFHTPALQAERTELVEAGLKALAAPVQEPVAWYRDENGIRIYYESKCWDDATPLYTTPPAAQRQWVWLTDEEIRNWWSSENGLEDCDMCKIDNFVMVVKAIEAKLKEKNT